MCTSVPQIDALRTRMSTSSPRTSGTGTSSSHRPGSALAFTTAFIIFCTMANYANQQSRKGFLQFRLCVTLISMRPIGRAMVLSEHAQWRQPCNEKKLIFGLDEHLPFWEKAFQG